MFAKAQRRFLVARGNNSAPAQTRLLWFARLLATEYILTGSQSDSASDQHPKKDLSKTSLCCLYFVCETKEAPQWVDLTARVESGENDIYFLGCISNKYMKTNNEKEAKLSPLFWPESPSLERPAALFIADFARQSAKKEKNNLPCSSEHCSSPQQNRHRKTRKIAKHN